MYIIESYLYVHDTFNFIFVFSSDLERERTRVRSNEE